MNEGMQGFLRSRRRHRRTVVERGGKRSPATANIPAGAGPGTIGRAVSSVNGTRARHRPAANRWRIELYPISTGNNIGLGSGRQPAPARLWWIWDTA